MRSPRCRGSLGLCTRPRFGLLKRGCPASAYGFLREGLRRCALGILAALVRPYPPSRRLPLRCVRSSVRLDVVRESPGCPRFPGRLVVRSLGCPPRVLASICSVRRLSAVPASQGPCAVVKVLVLVSILVYHVLSTCTYQIEATLGQLPPWKPVRPGTGRFHRTGPSRPGTYLELTSNCPKAARRRSAEAPGSKVRGNTHPGALALPGPPLASPADLYGQGPVPHGRQRGQLVAHLVSLC